MRHATWMECDERTPEQIRQDRLRYLRHEEAELVKRLALVRIAIEEANKP